MLGAGPGIRKRKLQRQSRDAGDGRARMLSTLEHKEVHEFMKYCLHLVLGAAIAMCVSIVS